jgi:hypothetical protein
MEKHTSNRLMPYGVERLGIIANSSDFLFELSKLIDYCKVNTGLKTPEFHNMTTRLLNYISQTENATLALELSEVLNQIQKKFNFDFSGRSTFIHQICDLILIQFSH